jgi:hypothetical protein
MVKAIARAFRWREMLENGAHATIAEIAGAERINESYVGRVLRLTLLAPDIVEAILTKRQSSAMTPATSMQPFPVSWQEQVATFSSASLDEAVRDVSRSSATAELTHGLGTRVAVWHRRRDGATSYAHPSPHGLRRLACQSCARSVT